MKRVLAFGKVIFGVSLLWILIFQVSPDVNSQAGDAAEIAADLAAGVTYAPPSGVVLFRPTQRAPRPPEAITPGPNVAVCPDPNPQNKTSIAAYLPHVGHLVGGANDYRAGDSRAGFYHSTDGGANWNCALIPTAISPSATQGDPAVASDTAGNFYYAYIEFMRTDNRNGIYVNKGNGFGPGTSSPVIVHLNSSTRFFEDKEYVVADTSPTSPFKDRVYVSWTKFTLLGIFGIPRIFIASSPTGEAPWTSSPVSDTRNEQGSVPAVGPDGTVYVAWEHFQNRQKPHAILIDQSTDGGLTWGADQTVATITPLPSPLPPTSFRVNSFPTLAVGNVGPNQVFQICVAWADYRNGDGDILFSSASSIAGPWSAPIRINDDPIGNGKDQFFPWMSIDPDGKIVIVFYDRRDDATNVKFHLYSVVSTDGGTTWENTRISDVASDPANDGFGGTFIGDYNGVVALNNQFHPLWTDTRSGNADAFTAATATIPTGGWPSDPTVNVPISTAAGDQQPIPLVTQAFQNYPNPFNPETWLPYQLARSAQVVIRIYDVRGHLVRTFDLGEQPPGVYLEKSRAAHWDGRNQKGEVVPGGVYFYTLQAGDFQVTRKFVILK
ncbi:T9SS type A sorting domain-containing protein [Candidatus Poribacteria bacterium]|nr:T9SS type A sorting domain-containing protein [Candidatus Poribacteria bacterium]